MPPDLRIMPSLLRTMPPLLRLMPSDLRTCHRTCGLSIGQGILRLRLGHKRVVDHLHHGIMEMDGLLFLGGREARLVIGLA